MNEQKSQMINASEICSVCGKELPTESNRIICKECEQKYEGYTTKR
jgi:predicted amidophosphoribosyltransferase